jgi:HK97 family phage major capsid protein
MPAPDTEQPTNNLRRGLQQIEDRQRAITAELTRIGEIQEPTDMDVAWQETLITEYDSNEVLAGPLRKRAADLKRIAAANVVADNREPATDDAPAESYRARVGSPDVLIGRDKRDPLSDMERVRGNLVSSRELRTRALDLIDRDHRDQRRYFPDDHAEAASVRADLPGIARHILLTGSDEYATAFQDYLEKPEEYEPRLRAINLTNASGGYLLPYVLDPTIILTNSASANPFRRLARVVQTTSNAWQGVNSAGVTAAWTTEGATAADSWTGDLGQIQVKPQKAAAWVYGSYEALDDEDFGTQLPRLLSDAKDRLESAAFSTGSGTNQPLGFIPGGFNAAGTNAWAPGGSALAATGTAVTGTATFAPSDLYNLQASLPPRFRNSPSAAWVASLNYINKLRQIDVYGGSSFWANFGSDTPEQLLGKPIYEASDMSTTMTGVTGSGGVAVAYADWNQFIICDRVGVSMLYDPMVKGSGTFLPSGNAGWYMFWRTSSTTGTTAAFRYLVNGSASH